MPAPQKPSQDQCCGSGCKRCVFDVYDEELRIWQAACVQGAASGQEEERRIEMQPDSYVSCEILSVQRVCDNVNLFCFAVPDGSKLVLKPCQHLVARESVSESETICRPYTVASLPSEAARGRFSVLIKLYESGAMSTVIRARWVPGYKVSWRGPFGLLNYAANQMKHALLIAAGTGLVPVYQLAMLVVSDECDETKITLLYCCTSYEQVLLRRELCELQGYWNVQVRYYMNGARVEDTERRHNELVCYSSLTEEAVRFEMERLPAADHIGVYVCGPKKFENDVAGYLVKLGVRPTSIMTF